MFLVVAFAYKLSSPNQMKITLGFWFGITIGLAIWLADTGRFSGPPCRHEFGPLINRCLSEETEANGACLILFKDRLPIGYFYAGSTPDCFQECNSMFRNHPLAGKSRVWMQEGFQTDDYYRMEYSISGKLHDELWGENGKWRNDHNKNPPCHKNHMN